MSLITLDKLGITLGKRLFSGLDLTIHKGDRIGLVAANGQGKSTLLQCLAGQLEPSDGELLRARSMRLTLMRQEPGDDLLRATVRDVVLDPLPLDTREWEGWRAELVLERLRVPSSLWDEPLGALSGGWQRMVLLAQSWVSEPDVLLMDEPTNHLDLARIGQLQRWISELSRDTTLVIASHDRAFLDAVTSRTLFLRAEGSTVFSAPFSQARASLAERDAASARRHESDLRQAAQLRRQAAKLHNIGVNSGSDLLTVKTRQLKDRADRIENATRPTHRDLSAGRIRLSESGTDAKILVALDACEISTPMGERLFISGRKWIRPGDRVVVLGLNGTGKSRLVELVSSAMRGRAVEGLRCGPSIVPGICDQTISHLGAEETVSGALTRRFSLGDARLRVLLAGAGFPIERQNQQVSALSGGQRARLAMLILRLEEPNFYVLDEPTNHLDIEGQEMLEGEITSGQAACLLVSHDRRFVERVGNRFWQIENGRLNEVDTPYPFFDQALTAAGP